MVSCLPYLPSWLLQEAEPHTDCDSEAAETEHVHMMTKQAALECLCLYTAEHLSRKTCNLRLLLSSLLKRLAWTEVFIKVCTYVIYPYIMYEGFFLNVEVLP